ncbi:hypothetical protein [Occultella aeris]|uniref:hypothetical protein n=1 Tax=Occultella aeris TaxID=2761496 RepID=UPI0012E9FE26|nr:hypothetical protein [Occultella aeris]
MEQLARLGRIALAVVLALGGLLILAEALHNLPAALSVARGEGAAGVFTTNAVDCTPSGRGGELCAWSGQFVSADDAVVIEDAWVETDKPPYELDEEYPARFLGVGDQVHLVNGGEFGDVILMFAIGPALMAAGVWYFLYERRQQGRGGRHSRRRGDARES